MTGIDERLEQAPFGILVSNSDGTVRAANDAAQSLLDLPDGPAEGADIRSVFPRSVDRPIAGAFDDGEGVAEREFEEYYPDLERWLSVTLTQTGEDVTVYVRDTTERKQAEQTTADLRGELERVMVTDRLVSEVLSELVDASTREEIAETICERLGSTDLYEFAWVGEREVGSGDIVVRASSGVTRQMLDPVRETLRSEETTAEEQAVETGTLQVVQPLADDPSVPDAVRQAAFAGGLQSLLAIPLTYGSSVYGVVGVYATGQEAFSAREQESFRTVGEMAGFAVNAAKHRTLLLSDSVIEVTFGLAADSGPLVSTTATVDAEVTLDGMVPREDGGVLCYVLVEGVDPERAVDALAEREGCTGARVVTQEETTGVVEATMGAETPLGHLLARGATIESGEYEDGTGRIVCEFAPEEDVRRIADTVARRFDGEVVAKRREERDVTTPTEFRDELRDTLTDKQETALRTAFFADYFESPRGSSAEEVASALDISGPTLLYHLRAGQRKLLEAFFDSRTTDERSSRDRD